VKRSFVTSTRLLLAANRSFSLADPNSEGRLHHERRIPKVEYRRKKAPFFEIPACGGRTCEHSVPDASDIAERAKLAIHAGRADSDDFSDLACVGDLGSLTPPLSRGTP
jgi:hypothetical protein